MNEQKLREDESFGIIDIFEWDNCKEESCEDLDFLPVCRCCGDLYLIEKEDLDKIIDFAVFDCSSCSVKLKVYLYYNTGIFISAFPGYKV